MKKKLDSNPYTKKQTEVIDDGEGGIIWQTSQDVTDIIESNKTQYNLNYGKWSDDVFGNKIASIPLAVIDDLNRQGIMRGFHVMDQKRFKAWLNHPDNRFFRTRQGTV